VNPDGAALGQRWTERGVDLNRNLPTGDWTPEIKNPRYPPGPSAASEPENKALVKLIDTIRPVAILSAHSFTQPQINVNGPARPWGERLAAVCGYPVTEDIGYPTPGSLGTYAGKERGIPTITLEIERGLPRERVLALHVPVAEEAVRYWNEREEPRA
jgi:protein MpaA